MRFKTGMVVAALLLVTALARAEDENPLKSAKVGDWIEYKSVMSGPANIESSMKQTVTAKTDDELTIDMVMKTPAGEQKQTMKIDLKKKYDPRGMGGEGEFKEIDKGEETIEVAGKTLKTQWSTYEITMKNGPVKSIKGKSWVCKDVPLGGLV